MSDKQTADKYNIIYDAQVLLKTFNNLEKLARDLITENNNLKNKIDQLESQKNTNIRVTVKYDEYGNLEVCDRTVIKNATLTLDNPDMYKR